jgi:hypothetical protein
MKNNSILILIITILFGCDKQVTHNESSSELIITNNDSKEESFDSLHIEKDKNGKITSMCNYKHGLQHGLCRFYFNNGQIQEEGIYYLGKPIGTFKYYSNKGVLEQIREYQIVKGESVINQIRVFDEKGKIIKNKSNYISLLTNKDTIALGEEYFLNIKLEAPYFNNSMDVVIGNFDGEYNLVDSLNYIKLKGNNFEAQYKLKAIKSGENVIRGIIKDYKKMNNSDTLEARRNIYFTKRYFVVE